VLVTKKARKLRWSRRWQGERGDDAGLSLDVMLFRFFLCEPREPGLSTVRAKRVKGTGRIDDEGGVLRIRCNRP
jgi:hypothetical protein